MLEMLRCPHCKKICENPDRSIEENMLYLCLSCENAAIIHDNKMMCLTAEEIQIYLGILGQMFEEIKEIRRIKFAVKVMMN